jgi:hypothetical protein
MSDFEVNIEVSSGRDGTEIDRILITGKDGEIILDKSMTFVYIYPDELLNLGKWKGFNGFTLNPVSTDG